MAFSERLRDALWRFKQSRKAKVTVLVILVVLVATLSGYVLFAGGGPTSNDGIATTNSVDELAQQRVERAIDGVTVPVSQANYYPTCVVIENLVAARPQAGLDQANLVYEALAEGGITRFLAVFASGDTVAKIGPVRSARVAHLEWAKELNCLFAHAGGSPAALKAIPEYGINDFNQFFNGQYFDRDPELLKTRAREHTLFTTSVLLARALRDKEAPLVGTFEPWEFQAAAPLASRPTDPKSMTIEFSTFNYKVDYRYRRETNDYARMQAEQPHTMISGDEIIASNVVVQYVPTKLADNEGRLDMELIGEGPAVVFQNGQAINTTWKKTTRGSRTKYFDAQGVEIRFVAGTTWIEIVPSDREVSYT